MTLVPHNPIFDRSVRARLNRLQALALQSGAIGLLLGFGAGLRWPHRFAVSYLVGYLFWVGIALGCIGLTMLHHLVGGQWGLPIRRSMEAGAMTLAPLAVLFIPVILNLGRLYPWANDAAVRLEPALNHKHWYLNEPFFVARAAFYFCLWSVLALLLNRWSRAEEGGPDGRSSHRLRQLSGPGLSILFLSNSFAAIDWGMSLEPKWFSTIYGVTFITGEALSTLAFMIVTAILRSTDGPREELLTSSRLHDLGNLILAFVMLWAYMAFSQYLIVWSGDLSEETSWYIRRAHGGWQWIALLLIGFHFVLPFFVLLFRESKREPRLLMSVALVVLTMHLIDLTWLVIPASTEITGPRIPWEDAPLILITTVGIGGIWVGTFLWNLTHDIRVSLRDVETGSTVEQPGGD